MSEEAKVVLIIDDEEGIREILSEKLSLSGYRCLKAGSGTEGLELLERDTVDLVICDIRMKGIDGIETLKRIMKNREGRVPVIMVTAIQELEVAVTALNHGASDYITKPFNLDEVVIGVERALEKQRLIEENRRYQQELEERVLEQTKHIEEILCEDIKARVLQTFYQTSQMLNSLEHVEKTLQHMPSAIMKLVSAERGAIFTYSPKKKVFEPRTCVNLSTRSLQELRAFNDHLIGLGGSNGLLFSTNAMEDGRIKDHKFVTNHRVRSLASVLLKSRSETNGCIYVDSKSNEFDLSIYGSEFFKAFASLAGIAVANSRAQSDLRREVSYLKKEVDRVYQYDNIIGESAQMQQVFALTEKVKDTDSTVLIMGETGTGKEKIARLIHKLSPRRDKPFIPVNSAAFPPDLLESELFGIEKGTATGVSERIGKFELAEGGTLFLDEIGDLSAAAQAKILRVIQEKTLERIGSNIPVQLDIRLITATNIDLKKAVAEKRFREDLYYRLNVLPIYIPPLRERRQDIPPLVRYYMDKFCLELSKPPLQIDDKTMESFVLPSWKGNIRELRNAVERSVILSDGEYLVPYQSETLYTPTTIKLDLEPAINMQFSEKELITNYALTAFRRFKRYDRTSEFLGISFKTLKKRLEDAKLLS